VGSMWIEHYGDLVIKNITTGDSVTVEFTKSGLWKIGCEYKVAGVVTDKAGKKIIRLKGEWNSELQAEWLEETASHKKHSKLELWKPVENDFKGLPYKMTKFSISLNALPADQADFILPSDSRRRLDRYYLERGYADVGTQWKKVGEYRQREDHRVREGDGKKSKDEPFDRWTPLWFVPSTTDLTGGPAGGPFWEFSGKYWDFRKKRIEDVKKGETGPWKIPEIAGTACDFASYFDKWSDLLGKELVPAAAIEQAETQKSLMKSRAAEDIEEDVASPRKEEKKKNKDPKDKKDKKDKEPKDKKDKDKKDKDKAKDK